MDLPAPYLSLVALLVVGVLGLVLRWAFTTDDRRKDYGLLREVAKVPSQTAARFVEERLQAAGVRATTVPAEDGEGLRVLVFPADERAAIAALLDD
ncbi:hypothetical protein [Actinokineospora sp. NBRC 105648]|uniref:hypothetical protein n=1 Tax=Actinokineospora sp. NBRC 105648 TaxID=3032206 RepID=UPI0024A38D47|nr:hypothetical protein [Actinokineospora sp. NBRC 105648]GLZ39132.1 hypothetical protein Acsp05_27560 [Actinokineospora sp. NBRC 105648]